MKVVLLSGSHPRHYYVANTLLENGLLHGHIIEQREAFVPTPPEGLEPIDRENFIRHFREREEAEYAFFGKHKKVFGDIPTLVISKSELNGKKMIQWLQEQQPDVVLTYGVHKIDDHVIDMLPDYAWNIHGGLSPWYRGNITLFWPFYMLRPNWAGMTIHRLTSKLDGGDIVHHSVPKLEYGDGIHDVACKAVKKVVEDLVEILKRLQNGKVPNYVPQKSNGKLFVATDWTPQHLRLIYQTFNNDIVDHYLDGKLGHVEPKLVNALTD
ncbi:formyl transferase [Parageobacillus thermoglucosidasius]|uniref:formyl transferase n=1 Tax=Parageobacillus thermoglucosidasius TaxID=1426 RepID=UPI003D28DD33